MRCGFIIPKREGNNNAGLQCHRKAQADGFCKYHSSKKPATKGCIDNWGYRVIYVRGRKIREHRYVMEQMLGRRLTKDEHVHHKNDDPLDNRPENLQLLSPSDHQKLTTADYRLVPPLMTLNGMMPRYTPSLIRKTRRKH